ncbi:hypothetical protein HXX76_008528 [Chlamydomonas incerta]|uniref:Uncharacterized protein n=1 Tax=Chlamydomonas incerta TaxID=51695 RepID=A0A835W0R7_CHLIN|nr:hypothetical protein HXX76_008528 [Chlamydomonas incerta]|eukprot:KAG2432794.1 hypothetical protein HXX76_008528 [Chlamydomonas incerta]
MEWEVAAAMAAGRGAAAAAAVSWPASKFGVAEAAELAVAHADEARSSVSCWHAVHDAMKATFVLDVR